MPTHQLSLFGSSCPYFLTIFTLCRSRGVRCIFIGPYGSFVTRLIITLSYICTVFFRLKSIFTYHSSFDFPSFLKGSQGRWYDPNLQMTKIEASGARILESPSGALSSIVHPPQLTQGLCFMGHYTQEPKGTQTSPLCPLQGFSTAVPIIFQVPRFLSSVERRKNIIAPQVLPIHFF